MSQKESFFSVQDGKPVDPLQFGYADIFHHGRKDSQQRLKKTADGRTRADQTVSNHEDEILRCILARVDRIRGRGGSSPIQIEQEVLMEEPYDRANLFRISKANGSKTKQYVSGEHRHSKGEPAQHTQNATEPLRSTTQKYLSNLFSHLNFPATAQRNRKQPIQSVVAQGNTQDYSMGQVKTVNEEKLRSTIAHFRESGRKLPSYDRESKNNLIRTRHSRRSSFGKSLQQPLRESDQYIDWLTIINWTNAIHQTVQPTGSYRALLERGNNHRLVKTALKSRPWWVVVECSNIEAIGNLGEYNLIWSQNKYQRVIQLLPEHSVRVYSQNFRRRALQVNLGTRTYPKGAASEHQQGLGRLVPGCSTPDCIVITPSIRYQQYSYSPNILKVHNHLEYHRELSNKKSLFKNLKSYYSKKGVDPFEYIPITYHVTGQTDPQFAEFQLNFPMSKVWLVKPGENTNRGTGIDVVDSVESAGESIRKHAGKHRTFILQQYIIPFLYERRKFDIRCYVLVTSINHTIKGYWYDEGYIRTSSKLFTLDNLSTRLVHLTNDAVQKKSEDYGKYEPANKLSFHDFEKYLGEHHPQLSFWRSVYPKLISLASDSLEASWELLDRRHRQHTFEVFGLDFLIDEGFKPWLIEVNTNPCLEESSSLLGRIIPSMLDNALKIALDPIFPPPRPKEGRMLKLPNPFPSNKFTIIFNRHASAKTLTRTVETPILDPTLQDEQQQ